MATLITPEQLAKSGTEHSEQTALFCWASINAQHDERLRYMFAIPNGGLRNKVTASRLKAEGAKSGVLDILLPVPKVSKFPPFEILYCGFFIEMKKSGLENHKNGGLSDEQVKWKGWLESQKYFAEVHYSWLTAARSIVNYLA